MSDLMGKANLTAKDIAKAKDALDAQPKGGTPDPIGKPDPKPAPEPIETPFGKAFVALMSEEYCRDWGPCDPHVAKFFKRAAVKVEKLLG